VTLGRIVDVAGGALGSILLTAGGTVVSMLWFRAPSGRDNDFVMVRCSTGISEEGVRLAQKMQVGPHNTVGIQL
jgi:hypothetical protein